MNKSNWVRKLTSRKLWLSVGSFIGMMIVATGGTESEAAQVTALIMAGATVLGYVIGEGLVDGANKQPQVNSIKSWEADQSELEEEE